MVMESKESSWTLLLFLIFCFYILVLFLSRWRYKVIENKQFKPTFFLHKTRINTLKINCSSFDFENLYLSIFQFLLYSTNFFNLITIR